jgi:hypothetical protein
MIEILLLIAYGLLWLICHVVWWMFLGLGVVQLVKILTK